MRKFLIPNVRLTFVKSYERVDSPDRFDYNALELYNPYTANIREGNGTDCARITAVPDGTMPEHIATATNGWHAVIVGSRVGWVPGSTVN